MGISLTVIPCIVVSRIITTLIGSISQPSVLHVCILRSTIELIAPLQRLTSLISCTECSLFCHSRNNGRLDLLTNNHVSKVDNVPLNILSGLDKERSTSRNLIHLNTEVYNSLVTIVRAVELNLRRLQQVNNYISIQLGRQLKRCSLERQHDSIPLLCQHLTIVTNKVNVVVSVMRLSSLQLTKQILVS